ncbi:MAG: MFS transporter [Aestuariivirga sp.]|uniref:MFS transporter n=1 Tax=Aestuariivirga sp. TaxID=2650926 RepID=UPI0025C4DF0E|nr:MFS transporter [Aestuariivirga sp.]MCA3561244.1 MFS transporter [Aestuariivirga sp.]
MTAQSGRSVEAVLLFTGFIASTYGFGLYLFPAMVEAIRSDIPFSYGVMGVMSGAVQAGFMVAALMAGFLTVRLGALPMILGSIAICVTGLGALAAAQSVLMIAILLTLLGGCAAAIWVPMVEVSKEIVPKQHQGKALGLMSSGTSYGIFVNSFLLTLLLPAFGWRSLWIATCLIVGALAILGFLRLRRLGKREAPSDLPAAPGPRTSLAARLAALPKGLTATIIFMMFLNGLSCMPYQTYLSAYLQGEAGYTADTSAYVWRFIGIVGMFSGFAIGALADRITVRWGMFITYLVLAVSCCLVVIAKQGAGQLPVYLAAVTFGISFYAIFGLVPAYISHMFGLGSAALVFAFGNIALGFGGIVGNMLGGVMKESTGSFQPVYLMMLGAALLSAIISWLMPSERTENGAMQAADV